jgi:hypothetical protein
MSRFTAALVALGAILVASAGWAEPSTDVEDVSEASDTGAEAAQGLGVSALVGPLVLSRSMHMRAEAHTIEPQSNVYFGASLSLAAELVEVGESGVKIGLDGELGWAASRAEPSAGEFNTRLPSEATFARGRLLVRRAVSEDVAVDVGLGASVDSFIVEANHLYTGHRYVSADVRAGVKWAPSTSSWSAGADVSALPVLALDESSDARGDNSAFGVRLGLQAGADVPMSSSSGARLMLRYDYSRFRSQFPQTRVGLDDGVSEDNIHALTLAVGYFL